MNKKNAITLAAVGLGLVGILSVAAVIANRKSEARAEEARRSATENPMGESHGTLARLVDIGPAPDFILDRIDG
ncbi:MAG: hypothetical protein KDB53_19950, partial [Planctomycetes bacterium]|nr:hypothetical protein [Planctomycetota bacterium]